MSEGPSPEITAFFDGLRDILDKNSVPNEDDADECARTATSIWTQLSPLIGYLVKHERREKNINENENRRAGTNGFGLRDFKERGFGSSARLTGNTGKFEHERTKHISAHQQTEANGPCTVQLGPPPAQTGEVQTTKPPLPGGERSIQLPNASVGQPYECVIHVSGLRSARVQNDHDSGIDIALDGENVKFSGIPRTHGNFQIRMASQVGDSPLEIKANLWVNPDPRGLWKSEPSDQEAEFAKPDNGFGTINGPLFGAGASKRGRSHAHDGRFRDDDFGLSHTTSTGWHIAVVADGAGSAPLSRRGSQLAVETILERLPLLLEERLEPEIERLARAFVADGAAPGYDIKKVLFETLAAAARQAAKAIEEQASEAGKPASDFSTTLIVCVARLVSVGWFFAGFSIGDGGAAVLDVEDGTVRTLAAPDGGAFAGQTKFLHSSEFDGGYEALAERIFFAVRDQFSALLVMTDGITDPKFPTEAAYTSAAEWKNFWLNDLTRSVRFRKDNNELEKQLLDWLDFWSKGNHDDRTLVVLVPGQTAVA